MKDYAIPFSAWELRLYLDTHPCDERALAAYRQLCAANPGGKCNYACAVNDGGGCSCGTDDKVWRWIDDPWPWEPEANCTGGDQ